MAPRETFEQLAERGSRRGADAVLDAARRLDGASSGRHSAPWLIPVAVATAVAVLIAIVAWPSGDDDSQQVVTRPPTSGLGPFQGTPASGPLFGVALDTTLMLSSQSGTFTALDLDTGFARVYASNGSLCDACHLLAAIEDRLLYLVDLDSQAGDEDAVGVDNMPPSVAIRSADMTDSAQIYVDGTRFIPSGRAGRTWLEYEQPDGRPSSVTEVSVDGFTSTSRARVPDGYGPELAAGEMLLLVSGGWTVPPRPRSAQLWNPATGEVTRRFEGVAPLASMGTRLALADECTGSFDGTGTDDRCDSVRILDVETGGEVTTDISGADIDLGQPGNGAAFSPDGSLLALWPPFGAGAQRYLTIDAASGATVSSGDLPLGELGGSVTWSPDSRHLLVHSGDNGGSSTLALIDARSGAVQLIRTSAIEADTFVAVTRAQGPALGTSSAAPCAGYLGAEVVGRCLINVDDGG